jgi:hypothetical protein
VCRACHFAHHDRLSLTAIGVASDSMFAIRASRDRLPKCFSCSPVSVS